MENLLKDFEISDKNPSEEAQRRWRSSVAVVRNRRRRFRMVADLAKRADLVADLADLETQEIPVVNHERSAPAPPIQPTSAYQVLPAHQLQSADPAPPAFHPLSVDQAPLALQLQSVEPPLQLQSVDSGAQRTLGSSNIDPDAPRSVTSGISAGTLFKALLGVIFAATEALMLSRLQQQGNSAPASSKIALTMVCVTFLLAFLFIATGACMYKRFPVAAYITGNAGFLCITLSFFAMMQVCVPKHLVGLVWTVCGILLLVFAYFFKEDLKGKIR